MTILSGKLLADRICGNLKLRVDRLKESGVQPELMIITSGDNDAGLVYVRNKIKRCKEIGIYPIVKHLHELTDQDVAENCAENKPIIFQMPMNGEVEPHDITRYIDPMCDVDGFASKVNVAALANGETPYHYPCTPKGIIRLLEANGVALSGKTVCVIGRSNIVGRPIARMMEQADATVTLCHSKTPQHELYRYVGSSDIIVSATGCRNTLTFNAMEHFGEFVHLGRQVFVDVGMNRDENGKLCGDIDPMIYEYCNAYTPVPGGIGPMTVAMLMENTVEFYERIGSV